MRSFPVLATLLISITVFSQQEPTKKQGSTQQASTQQEPSNDIQRYAPYNIALFMPNPQGGDVVLPFMTKSNSLAGCGKIASEAEFLFLLLA